MPEGKTRGNLHSTHEGESKFSVQLDMFAEIAEEEGYLGVAKLLRAVSAGEEIHSRNSLRLMGTAKDTMANLLAAFTHDQAAGISYGKFAAQAQADGDKKAAEMFARAREVEKTHMKLFKEALESIGHLEVAAYQVCAECGRVSTVPATENCPICGAPPDRFYRIR